METGASVGKALPRCLLAAALILLAGRAAASQGAGAGSAVEPSPGPRLVWSDPERLFPAGLDRLNAELSELFSALGADVVLRPADAVAERLAGDSLRIDVMREPRPHWRLRGDAMAAAPRMEGSAGTIYLFLEQVRAVLGHLGRPSPSEVPRQNAELTRAVARILAHEVVHAVAPDHPHATSGLMVAELRRAALLKRRVRVDPVCARAFRAALESGGRRLAASASTPR